MPKTSKQRNTPEIGAAAAAAADEAKKVATQITIPRDEVLRRVTIANRIQSYSNPVQALRNAKINADFRDATEAYPFHFYLPFLQKNVYVPQNSNERARFLNNPFGRKRKYLWLQVESHEEMTSPWFWSSVRTGPMGQKEHLAHTDFSYADLTTQEAKTWLLDDERDHTSAEPVIRLLQEHNEKSTSAESTTPARKLSIEALIEGLTLHSDEVVILLLQAFFTGHQALFDYIFRLVLRIDNQERTLTDILCRVVATIYVRLDRKMPHHSTHAPHLRDMAELLIKIQRVYRVVDMDYTFLLFTAFAAREPRLFNHLLEIEAIEASVKKEPQILLAGNRLTANNCLFISACSSGMLEQIKTLRNIYAGVHLGNYILHGVLGQALSAAAYHDQVQVISYLFSLKAELETYRKASIDLAPAQLLKIALERGAFKSLRLILDAWKNKLIDLEKCRLININNIVILCNHNLSCHKKAITKAEVELLLETFNDVFRYGLDPIRILWKTLGCLENSLRSDRRFRTKLALEEERQIAQVSVISLLELLHLPTATPILRGDAYNLYLSPEWHNSSGAQLPWDLQPRVQMRTFYTHYFLIKRWLEDYVTVEREKYAAVDQYLHFLRASMKEVPSPHKFEEMSSEKMIWTIAQFTTLISVYKDNTHIQVPENIYNLCSDIARELYYIAGETRGKMLPITVEEMAQLNHEENAAQARLELHAYWHHLRSDERKQKTAAHRDVSAANKRAGVELAMEILMQPSRDNMTIKQKLSDAVKKLEEWKIHYRSTTNKAGFECTTTGAGVLNRIRKLAAR